MQIQTAIANAAPMRSLAMDADCDTSCVNATRSSRRRLPCAMQPMLSPIYQSVN
jgi:hypothetical protein